MKKSIYAFFVFLSIASTSSAQVKRWVDSVAAFSSQYHPTPGTWSVKQLTDTPNTYPAYGDIGTAWAPSSPDNSREWLELHFGGIPARVFAVNIYETYYPGAVDTIYAYHADSARWEVLWSGTAVALPAVSRIFHASFPPTDYPVSLIRLAINSSAITGYNEIDAVNVQDTLVTITPGGPVTFCAGDSVTLTASAASTYSWSPDGETTQSITVKTGGSYMVTVTGGPTPGYSYPTVVTVIPVSVPDTPGVILASLPAVCSGNNVIYSVTGGALPNLIYSWTVPAAGAIVGNAAGGSITVHYNANPSGNDSVKVKATSPCNVTASAWRSLAVVANPVGATGAISGSTGVCRGFSTYSIPAPVSNADGYIWSVPGTTTGISINGGGTSATISGMSNTSVYITVQPAFTGPAVVLSVKAYNACNPQGGAAQTVTLTLVNTCPRWVDSVYAFSSQYSAAPGNWSSYQVKGMPNTFPSYGDITTAWASSSPDAAREWLVLHFAGTPAPIRAVNIYETNRPGAVDTVYAFNPGSSQWEVLYSGAAVSNLPAASRIFRVAFPATSYPVSLIRLALNSGAVSSYNEIDAVSIEDTSVVTGAVEIVAGEEGIRIFPNPCTQDVTIMADAGMTGGKTPVKVTDVLGKEVYSAVLTSEKQVLQTAGWHSGIYFVRAGKVVRRLIKE